MYKNLGKISSHHAPVSIISVTWLLETRALIMRANVEQLHDVEGENIRQRLRQFRFDGSWEINERHKTLVAWDRYRVRVRDRARATSVSKRPPGQQQEEEDDLLLDIVDEYEAVRIATVFVCQLHPLVTKENLRTLFGQMHSIVDVYLPKDRATKRHQGYGFVEFQSRFGVNFAMSQLNGILLLGKPIVVIRAIQVKRGSLDAGANLFVTDRNPALDENEIDAILKEYGVSVKHIKMMKDPDSGGSLGSGFFNFDSFKPFFEAMNAIMKYPFCRLVKIFYACMKGDTPRDWMLASSSNPNTQKSRLYTTFASGPPLPSFGQPYGGTHDSRRGPTIFTRPSFVQHAQRYPSMQMPQFSTIPPLPQMSLPPPPQWQQMGQGMLPHHLQQSYSWPPPPPPQMMNWPPPPPAGMSMPPPQMMDRLPTREA